MTKKIMFLLTASVLSLGIMTGCSGNSGAAQSDDQNQTLIQSEDQSVIGGAEGSSVNTVIGTDKVNKDDADDGAGTTAAQTNGGGSYISEEEAASIALAEVSGATENDIRIHKDTDDGRNIYEGSIYYDGVEYDFEIDAQSGQIIDWSSEMDDDRWINAGNDMISVEEASAIALAEVKGASENDLRIHKDTDDGRNIYEGSIYYNGVEYDFEIDGQSGQIIDWSSEMDDDRWDDDNWDDDDNWNNNQNSGSTISEKKAKNIALGQVQGATDQNIRIHMDNDDGRQIYEGDIIYNGMEYEFEIDAQSGDIIDWSSESAYDD